MNYIMIYYLIFYLGSFVHPSEFQERFKDIDLVSPSNSPMSTQVFSLWAL